MGISAHELAQELEVGEQTAKRYIDMLGAQVVRKKHNRAFYNLPPSDKDIALADAVIRAMQRQIWRDGHITRRCWVCGDEFQSVTTQARYCSDACKREAQNERFYQYHKEE